MVTRKGKKKGTGQAPGPGDWPLLGQTDTNTTAHAHQLMKEATELQDAINARPKSASVPGHRLLPFCKSIESIVARILRQSQVSAWETQLNDIYNEQKQQAEHIKDLEKTVRNSIATLFQFPPTTATSTPHGSSKGPRSWAQTAAGGLPPAAQTVRTWTNATGTTHKEYVTEPQEREVVIKLHDSSLENGNAVRTWIQAQMATQPRALIDYVNGAIKKAAEEGAWAPLDDSEMTDSATGGGTIRPYKGIQAVSAIFLKSGDIRIHTPFAAQAKILLTYAGEWVKYVGNKATVVVPTYGVIIHAIPTYSFDATRMTAMAVRFQTFNAGILQGAQIPYMGWLTRTSSAKAASSLVVEFTAPEPANKLIHAGCLWSNETHLVERYDRSCRLKQCLRCQSYGHITTQCAAEHDICGFCSGSHDTRKCSVRTSSGTPKCANCRQKHSAWDSKCEYRRRELNRVKEALNNKAPYWSQSITPPDGTPAIVSLEPAAPASAPAPVPPSPPPTSPAPTAPSTIIFGPKGKGPAAPSDPASSSAPEASGITPERRPPPVIDFADTAMEVDFQIPKAHHKKTKRVLRKYGLGSSRHAPVDDELADSSPKVSLAEKGPNKKRKRVGSISGVFGDTPAKARNTPGTVTAAPAKKRAPKAPAASRATTAPTAATAATTITTPAATAAPTRGDDNDDDVGGDVDMVTSPGLKAVEPITITAEDSSSGSNFSDA